MTAIEKFTEKTRKLLDLERSEEIEETRKLWDSLSAKELQRRGVCLMKLQISGTRTGLYGRTVMTLELARHFAIRKLPSHSMTSGDIVGLYLSQSDHSGEMITSGIVTNVKEDCITIAFDESAEVLSLSEQDLYRITKLANDVTYKRIKRALGDMDKGQASRPSHLMDVLFGIIPPHTPSNQIQAALQPLAFYNQSLDDSQKEAVNFAIKQKEVAVIHGPPGTGKTTTIVEIILQTVKLQMKVLACAPSNIAVDNLVEKLGGQVRVVRLGHPARILQGIHKYSLDAVLSRTDAAQIVEDVRKDIDKTQSKYLKSRNKSERYKLREETKHLRKELKQRESKAIKEILSAADVILATNISASLDGPLKHLKENHFDVVVIDECAQALEASCWIPLLQVSKCILAGDHHQLPPTIMSNEASRDGLSISLMERIVNLHGDDVVRMLTTQYRMHDAIMSWSSHQLYQDRLTSHPSVAQHLLKDLAGVEDTEVTRIPLILIDTAGCDLYELDLEDEMSKANEGEVDLVEVHVDALISAGLKPSDIAVIAPYNLQVDLLRLRMSGKYPSLEIKSVDGFQGREKEAVVITMVRSNPKGVVGFLSEDRRMNVAVTRARRHLAVICDSETVSHHKFLKSLVDYMTDKGEVHTAFQYIESGQIGNNRQETTRYFQGSSNKAVKQKTVKEVVGKESQCKTKTAKPSEHLSRRQSENTTSDAELPVIEKQIEDFICDLNQSELVFPSTLTSRQRFHVHEVAEKRGLGHCSHGDGSDRHIVVSKTKQKGAISNVESSQGGVDQDIEAEVSDDDGGDQVEGEEEEEEVEDRGEELQEPQAPMQLRPTVSELSDGTATTGSTEEFFRCTICRKMIPSQNRLLHEINCEFQNKAHTTHSANQRVKSKEKVGKKKKKKAAEIDNVEDEDLDKLLAQVMKNDNLCSHSDCKESTRTLGQTCQFCRRLFCFSHHMAEVHGCGDQAKQSARSRLAQAHTGRTRKDRPLDPAARANLQRKMEKKMNELAQNRRTKSGKKK